ncbi:Hypothetical_protein [Hexamita inflata]|uniref:Hypothetical_protein n=1 Tax=Hexamita inflata TaxID=28002 RepID=A0AA86Q2M4_9EUKA|nr:Hypothetical protein HINF_LOCUS33040 [Hexamita inflata]
MPCDLTKLKVDEEVLVEISGSKFFYGIVTVVAADSFQLKRVRQVVNGQETPMGDPEKPIRFSNNLIVSVQQSTPEPIKEITDVISNNPNVPKKEVAIDELVNTMNLDEERAKFIQQKKDKIIEDCQKSGEDPAKKLQEVDVEKYDGKKSFFDNTDKAKHQYRPIKSQFKGSIKSSGGRGGPSKQSAVNNGGRAVAKGADGKW